MYVLGHVGLTVLARELGRRWRPLAALGALPLGWLVLGSLLPDLVDKPLGLLLGWGEGRLWTHTLLFTALLGLAAVVTRRPWVVALAVGVAGHLVLDRLWLQPVTLLWPMLGPFPHADWTLARYVELPSKSLYLVATEVLGALALGAALLLLRWRERRATRDT